MSASIHHTAVIHPTARVGMDCVIGPYCVVGAKVQLGDRCHLHSHVVIDGRTTLGSDNDVFPFACLGLKTQDLKWKGGVTRVEIGHHNTFREYVTVHSATADGGATVVGSHNHILAYCHLAHDTQLGDHIIMSNLAALAGHVTVADHAVIGGMAAVHQFCRIGRNAMLGGCSKVVQDVPPYMMADGNPAETRTINRVGLERAGFSSETIQTLNQAYKLLFRRGLTIPNALARIESELVGGAELAHLLEFVRSSQRGISK